MLYFATEFKTPENEILLTLYPGRKNSKHESRKKLSLTEVCSVCRLLHTNNNRNNIMRYY